MGKRIGALILIGMLFGQSRCLQDPDCGGRLDCNPLLLAAAYSACFPRGWSSYLQTGIASVTTPIVVPWTVKSVSDGSLVVARGDASYGSPLSGHHGSADLLLAKYDIFGRKMWHTFIGSAGSEVGDKRPGIVETADGYLIAFRSDSSWGAPRHPFGGTEDMTVAMVSREGALLWNTFTRFTGNATPFSIAADESGFTVFGGTNADAPAASGSLRLPFSGTTDAVAVRFGWDGVPVWRSFVGGGIAVNAIGGAAAGGGDVYLALRTTAALPMVPFNAERAAFPGGEALALVRLDANGDYLWHTYVGSGGTDQAFDFAVGANGELYAAGTTASPFSNPIRPHVGGIAVDGFLAATDAVGARTWATHLTAPAGPDPALPNPMIWQLRLANGKLAVLASADSEIAPSATPFNSASGSDSLIAVFSTDGQLSGLNYLSGNAQLTGLSMDAACDGGFLVSGLATPGLRSTAEQPISGGDTVLIHVRPDLNY